MTDVICDLPVDDRPRERMMQHGAETLSDAELLAILIGSGVPGKNAIQLARDLLRDGINALARRDAGDLMTVAGIGPAKAARIAAALDISRRIVIGDVALPDPVDVTDFGRTLVMRCAKYRQERLGAVFLDARHRIQEEREIFIGTVDKTFVSSRDIIRYAVLGSASGVVVWHNHPSGDPTPSNEDKTFTRKLRESLGLIDVELVDHLVIGLHGFCSMKEKGWT